jgi:hypothetical protein
MYKLNKESSGGTSIHLVEEESHQAHIPNEVMKIKQRELPRKKKKTERVPRSYPREHDRG